MWQSAQSPLEGPSADDTKALIPDQHGKGAMVVRSHKLSKVLSITNILDGFSTLHAGLSPFGTGSSNGQLLLLFCSRRLLVGLGKPRLTWTTTGTQYFLYAVDVATSGAVAMSPKHEPWMAVEVGGDGIETPTVNLVNGAFVVIIVHQITKKHTTSHKRSRGRMGARYHCLIHAGTIPVGVVVFVVNVVLMVVDDGSFLIRFT